MHILFLTHYFPPEVNAPASRTYENARHWVRAGHQVTVLTCVPNHPTGVVYPGYRNRLWQWAELEGIRVLRVKTYLGANKGYSKRIGNYLSYLISSTLLAPLVGGVDLVISTTPQFFCGLAGFAVSRLKGVPWVLEVRDLWPESIISVGAMRRGTVVRLLEGMEAFMYRRAGHVVVLTQAFKRHIMVRGVAPERITVITNGADLERFVPASRDNAFRAVHGLAGKFVASYVGTHGMAHALEVVLRAAELLRSDPRFVFLLVGDGADKERLLSEEKRLGLDNVMMLPQQPKERMPEILAASDASLVLLKNTDLFKKVIPSKMFESMAMARPIVLGVEGESREIVEEGGCGVCIEPENAEALVEALDLLAGDGALARRLGESGRELVIREYNRENLAQSFLALLCSIVGEAGDGIALPEHEPCHLKHLPQAGKRPACSGGAAPQGECYREPIRRLAGKN